MIRLHVTELCCEESATNLPKDSVEGKVEDYVGREIPWPAASGTDSYGSTSFDPEMNIAQNIRSSCCKVLACSKCRQGWGCNGLDELLHRGRWDAEPDKQCCNKVIVDLLGDDEAPNKPVECCLDVKEERCKTQALCLGIVREGPEEMSCKVGSPSSEAT